MIFWYSFLSLLVYSEGHYIYNVVWGIDFVHMNTAGFCDTLIHIAVCDMNDSLMEIFLPELLNGYEVVLKLRLKLWNCWHVELSVHYAMSNGLALYHNCEGVSLESGPGRFILPSLYMVNTQAAH